jgi:predicted amidophosphoribosyltransferase
MMRGLIFASCYVYSPAGSSAVCERSRLLRSVLKEGDTRFMSKYALRVHQQAEVSTQLAGFFRANDMLVPVPGSRPRSAVASWVAADLADALSSEGLGGTAWLGLRRIYAVRKSATAAAGARPTVALHYRSFLVARPPAIPESVVLIDDVVTKGRTLLAAVQRLLDPCTAEIKWLAGDARRNP